MKIFEFFKTPQGVKYGTIGGAVLILALLSKVLWMAVSGVIALNILAVASAVLFGMWKTIPWFMQKLDNEILELQKAEARKNPIAQKENMYRRGQEIYELRNQELTNLISNTRRMREMLTKRKEQTGQPLTEMFEDLKLMEKGIELKRVQLQDFAKKQEEYLKHIEHERFRYSWAQASRTTRDAIRKTQGDATTDMLLDNTASDEISMQYNQSFAELEVAFTTTSFGVKNLDMGMVEEVTPSLENNPTSSINQQSITETKKV